MSDLLPDDLARLEAALERRPRPAPAAALRHQVLADVQSARAVERRLLAGSVAAVLLLTLVLGSSRFVPAIDEARPLETDARVHKEGELLEQLGLESPDSQRALLALASARVPCIAPAVGSNADLSQLLRGW
jgi:hypothetical protein